MMNSIFHLQNAILSAKRENKENKYFLLFDKWCTVELQDGRVFKVKIIEENKNEYTR